MKKLEIACFNLASALLAQENGADRIELCADLQLGGTTPILDDVAQAQRQLDIELCIMIRPRGGDFNYSEEEFLQMKESILVYKMINVDGFVFGILTDDNKVDNDRNRELVELAKPIPCTFHRAFDQVENYTEALEDVIELGFSAILTSGSKSTALEGQHILKELIAKANNQITIIPGGGVRSTNLGELNNVINANIYHSSAIIDDGEIADASEVAALKNQLAAF